MSATRSRIQGVVSLIKKEMTLASVQVSLRPVPRHQQ